MAPYYRYAREEQGGPLKLFAPAIAVPEMNAAIHDICHNPDHALDLAHLQVDLGEYDRIRYWNGREELIYQVLLVNGVITIGSSETEVMRFPAEVRKADAIAGRILQVRAPELGAAAPRLRAVGGPR